LTSEAGLEVTASFGLQLGRVAEAMERSERWRVRCAGAIQQSPPVSAVPDGNGLIDQPDLFTARTGYIWSIRRLTCAGFSAGTVTFYKNALGGEPVAPFPEAAVFTYSKGQLVLQPGERLVGDASSATGSPQVQVWVTADVMESWYFPYYIN
jgi:hypothetical protein